MIRSGVLVHSLPVGICDIPVAINQDLKAFVSPDPRVNEWVAMALRWKSQDILAENRKDGTTVQSIRYEGLKALEIPLPPIREQKRIVAKVEELLARVNAARERLAKVPAILKRFRQSVLAAACSGQLTEGWRDKQAGVEPATVLLERLAVERQTQWQARNPKRCYRPPLANRARGTAVDSPIVGMDQFRSLLLGDNRWPCWPHEGPLHQFRHSVPP